MSIWTRFDGKQRELPHLFGERPADGVLPQRLESLLDGLEERCPHWEDAAIIGGFLGLSSALLAIVVPSL